MTPERFGTIIIGGVPMTNLVKKTGIEVDKRGCIKVDRRQATNVEGVYAAGDCTCGGMQIDRSWRRSDGSHTSVPIC